MYEESIAIVQIRQYCFCPRIPWYQVNSYSPMKENLWMTQGSEYHFDREALLKKRLLKRFQNQSVEIQYRVPVSSNFLKIQGIVDAILTTADSVFPIEFKMQKDSFSKGIFYQILAYGVSLEETLGKSCNMGFVISGKNARVREVKFSSQEKHDLAALVQRLREIQSTNYLPDSPATPERCVQCEYLNFCNDREV